jgi:hypothetical protein
MGSEKPSKKKGMTISQNLLRGICIAFSVVLGIVGLAVAIVALVSPNDSGSSNLKPNKSTLFKSSFDPQVVVYSSPNITTKLSILGDRIWIDVSTWTGTCTPAGSPPYAPSISTVSSIPNTYRPITSSGAFTSSSETSFRAESNSTMRTGFARVDTDGTLIFYVNENEQFDTWWLSCTINAFTMSFAKSASTS